MSVFSRIRLSKQAAKEHKQKEKEKDPNAIVKVPYKHVPTHAAVDALNGTPSSWKIDDRPKIREQHNRRSRMIISRTESSLSTVSSMNPDAGPSSQASLPRLNSYNTLSPLWFDRTEVAYSQEPAQKRYKQSRSHAYHDSGIGPSPLASNMHSEEASPVVSSGNSTTSNSSDNLELAITPNPNRVSVRPQPMVYSEKDIFERLHTSTTRKLGEAPLYDSPPVVIHGPMATIPAVPQEQKRQRWSLLGKKNTAAIAV